MLTDEQLKEIAEYCADRAQFPWKDVPGDTYQEHVGLLIAAVRQQRATLSQANEEIAQLREALPDPDKLELLARWFDYKYPVDTRPEIQTALRAWAKKARAVLHQEPPKGEKQE